MVQRESEIYMNLYGNAYMDNIKKMLDELDPKQDAKKIIQIYTLLKCMKERKKGN